VERLQRSERDEQHDDGQTEIRVSHGGGTGSMARDDPDVET
jgi:hypothetical protein